MGSTLEHGIYLPSEGEKNCYQGLAGNWNKVDGALGDIAELRQLIENKFTKEIVTELPTEDINPYCIYMILKTDPETDNIYDEWVYINNAWEYLGNTQVDMTQYYTKQEVNELPAVASGVTSTKVGNYDTHLADSNIHVTSADKSKWNTVALIKQLRLVNTQVGSATTIAFANIDDTNGIKVGDKCMDLDAKMFEITAVDTTNQTVTVGSALIDLALDANVVHTSGDESIIGSKRFGVVQSFTGYPSIRLYSSTDDITVVPPYVQQQDIRYTDKNNNIIAYFIFQHRTDTNEPFRTCWRQVRLDGTDGYYSVNFNNLGEFYPENNNAINLGRNGNRWKSVYATNYYYGANNVEFSTKFVTTDTAQTVSGAKTFSEDIVISNSDTSQTSKRLVIRSSKVNLGDSNSDSWGISFNAGASYVALINSEKSPNSMQGLSFSVRTKDTDNNLISASYRLRIYTDGSASLMPNETDSISLGSSANKWKDVQTNLVNGLTPSSLGMPSDRSARIDISSYFIYTGNNATNDYSVLANGYIFLKLNNINQITCYSTDSSSITNYAQTYTRPSDGVLYITFPVRKNDNFRTIWNTGSSVSVESAYFIPCQGNV